MSLLMDALKKAELAKRQGQGAGGSTDADAFAGLALEPLPEVVAEAAAAETPAADAPAAESRPSAGSPPNLASHLEELDAQFLAEAQRAAATRQKTPALFPQPEPLADKAAAFAEAPPAMAGRPLRITAATEPQAAPEKTAPADKAAAKNLFAAKQADKSSSSSRKNLAIAIGIITVLSVSGIGGYFWWQLQPKSALLAGRIAPPPITSSLAVPPAPTLAAPAVPSAPTLAPAALPAAAGPVAGRPAAPAADEDEDVVPAPVATRAPARPRRTAAPAAALAENDERILRVTRAPLQVNSALMRGFDAFNRGELVLAQLEYERARKSDPRNTDVLHGLAAIAVRQGRHDQAEVLYRQIAEADPQDAVAVAALINSRGQIDPHAAESRLKSLAAAQPELAAPHFSLGNLYARHGRWSEAQQAYFRAHNAEPGHPDILYNLAISLEHLRQNKLAAQYYSQALAAAQNRPAGFDQAQAAARLRALQP